MTLGEMLRQERFGAGLSDQKNLDAQFAKAIMGDGKFEVRVSLLHRDSDQHVFRTTWSIWMIMQPNLAVRKCDLMQ